MHVLILSQADLSELLVELERRGNINFIFDTGSAMVLDDLFQASAPSSSSSPTTRPTRASLSSGARSGSSGSTTTMSGGTQGEWTRKEMELE